VTEAGVLPDPSGDSGGTAPNATDVGIAFDAILSARRETFLARLPRAFKLAATALLLVFLAAPFFLTGGKKAARDVASSRSGSWTNGDEEAFASIPTTMDKTPNAERHAPRTQEEQRAAVANDLNDAPMSVAPDMDLAETAQGGVLPKVGRDGRRPWQVYAKTFDFRDPRPRVALVVGEMGLSPAATDAALRRLPRGVTLAFDAQGSTLKEWFTRARQDGFETLLSVPMEPFDYPSNDPGPGTLLTTLPVGDVIERLRGAMRLGYGYVGLTTSSGSRFLADAEKVRAVLDEARHRGLLFLDPHVSSRVFFAQEASAMKVPVAQNSRVIDAVPSPYAIDSALAHLEQVARVEGAVVALASPLPVTLERVALWAKHLGDRGAVLAPLSAVVK